ncbi:MAG: Txe/YoeB family addiction module toxin [Muribaculaceae bacterium]|nr:Txe/YoeB family addiction module toxin [Muribaculaceae bacterium]
MYRLEFTKEARSDFERLAKSDPTAIKKADKLLLELKEHPTSGTGRPEQLKGGMSGCWSRRINKKHRLIYRIIDDKVVVLVLSAYGHYNDK